jgi:MFS family permease
MIPLIWMLPESPRWLMKQERHEEALKIITVLRGDGDPDHENVRREYVEIMQTLEEDKNLADFNSYWRIMTDYKKDRLHYGRRAMLAFGIQMLVEIGTGISLTTIYAPTIFKQAGFSPYKAGWLSGVNGAMGIVGTICAVFLCDRFGRRINLMVGAFLMGSLMWVFAGLTKAAINDPEKQATYGAAACTMILLFTFTLCVFWMIPCFVYAAEIFPTALRAKGNGFLAAGWGLGIGSGVLWFPVVVGKLGYQTFYIFGVLNYVWVVVIYCFFPETAGRSLESIDLLFRSNSWFVWNNEKEFVRLQAEHEAGVTAGMRQLEKTGQTYMGKDTASTASMEKSGQAQMIEEHK